MHLGARIQIPTIFKFVLKWVAPIYLLVVFIAFCIEPNNLRKWIADVNASQTRQGALLLIGIVAAILIGCVYIGEKRWRRENIDIDDNRPLKD
jgi:hypothetical protein